MLNIRFLCVLLISLAGQARGQLALDQDIYLPVDGTTLYTGQGALVRDIPFIPVNKLKDVIEQRLGLKLQDRGEAHITIITPPEGVALKKIFSKDEWEQMALEEIPQLGFQAICVGVGRKGELATTFIVVNSESALIWRKQLQQRFVARGGNAQDFDPDVFYPHITLGFTERDLHIQDGVIKNSASCPDDFYFGPN